MKLLNLFKRKKDSVFKKITIKFVDGQEVIYENIAAYKRDNGFLILVFEKGGLAINESNVLTIEYEWKREENEL